MNWARLLELARTLTELPHDLRSLVEALPISYERVPGPDLLDDDEEPNGLLSLFVGGEFALEDQVPLPAQIILFLENIWATAESDEEDFREEVRITFIHEVGHYVGLDEDELEERGLL